MRTYLLDRLLALSAALAAVLLMIYVASWLFCGTPFCVREPNFLFQCLTFSSESEVQAYMDYLAGPPYDWWSVAIVVPFLIVIGELRAHLVPKHHGNQSSVAAMRT